MLSKSNPLKFISQYQFNELTQNCTYQLVDLADSSKLLQNNQICVPNEISNFDNYTRKIVKELDFKPVSFVLNICNFYYKSGVDAISNSNEKLKSNRKYRNHIKNNIISLYKRLSDYVTDYLKFYIDNEPFRFLLIFVSAEQILESFYEILAFDTTQVEYNGIIKKSRFYLFLDQMADGLIISDMLKNSFTNHLKARTDNANTYERDSIKRLLKRIDRGLNWWPHYYKIDSNLNEVQIIQLYKTLSNIVFSKETTLEDFQNLFRGNIYLMVKSKIVIKKNKLGDFVYLVDKVFKYSINDSKFCYYKFLQRPDGSVINENNIQKSRIYSKNRKISYNYIDQIISQIKLI